MQWLEDFKSKCGEYEEANETIQECENALALHRRVVDSARVPLLIQNARNARRADGSCLEYGLDYHLKNLSGQVSYPTQVELIYGFNFYLARKGNTRRPSLP